MIEEDQIRNDLGDPDIEITNIDSDEKGPYAMVVVSGTEDKLIRLTDEHFDIDGMLTSMGDRTRARLRPKR